MGKLLARLICWRKGHRILHVIDSVDWDHMNFGMAHITSSQYEPCTRCGKPYGPGVKRGPW